MNFAEYQEMARSTAVYPAQYQVIYPSLGLNGEAGEIAELIKKWIRDEQSHNMSEERKSKLLYELGDVLWYLANIASDLNLSLDMIAQLNIDKLKDRQDRNMLHGDGSNR